MSRLLDLGQSHSVADFCVFLEHLTVRGPWSALRNMPAVESPPVVLRDRSGKCISAPEAVSLLLGFHCVCYFLLFKGAVFYLFLYHVSVAFP